MQEKGFQRIGKGTGELVWWVMAVVVLASPAAAQIIVDPLINLEWRPLSSTVVVGESAYIGLYAVSDSLEEDQSFSTIDLHFTWSPTFLEFLGVDNTGAVDLMSSHIPYPDPLFHLNESNPPADGDGYYEAQVSFGQKRYATPSGTLLTTFEFEALQATSGTEVGMAEGITEVLWGDMPNADATGALGTTTIEIIPEPSSLALAVLMGFAILRRRL
ncbi:MAG: hypothetical protein KAV82_09590 [Phycisphaerae bacterium]|nr:hypothetical protein [Phycisphaerae bacterium]